MNSHCEAMLYLNNNWRLPDNFVFFCGMCEIFAIFAVLNENTSHALSNLYS